LLKDLPEADALVGTGDFSRIGEIIKSIVKGKQYSNISKVPDFLYDENSPRFTLTPCHYAYVKISEGCDNLCSYCIISRLRGRFRSRAVDSVIKEIEAVSSRGDTKEIDLIGQDTTLFGVDIYGKSVFPELLKKIAGSKNSIEWIRILYTHPAHYSDEFIFTIRDTPKICRYLDIPIQHINDAILKKMNRHITRKEIIELIGKIRKNIPGIALRTSIIVGFPGETEKAFKEMLDFLKEARFEKLGAFIYSREEGSRAYKFQGQIPENIKQQRFDEVMKTQQAISSDINRSFLGKTMKVLIDEKLEGNRYFGRTEFDAPEVDGGVYINGSGIRAGEFYNVKINDTLEYDLVGELA
jgi:ribosomal protein S12 methylthiotransferase